MAQLTLREGITTQQTLSPPAVIERSQVSDTLLVHSAVDRVVDHLPAYHEVQRAAGIGVLIPRSKLCRWHIALAQFLTGVADAIFDEIIASSVIGIDDSVHRRLVPNGRVCDTVQPDLTLRFSAGSGLSGRGRSPPDDHSLYTGLL